MEKLVQKLDDHERRLGALEGEYIEDDAQIEQYTQHEAPFSLMVEANNAPATDFRAITDISLAGYCEVVEELAAVDSQADWLAGDVSGVDAKTVPGSVVSPVVNIAENRMGADFENCAGRIDGDPARSNGTSVFLSGTAPGWKIAMNYAPVTDWGAIMNVGGAVGPKYLRWYESTGQAQWKGATAANPEKTWRVKAGKWYRGSVYARVSRANISANCYLFYGNTSGVSVAFTGNTQIPQANVWTRIVKTFMVPEAWAPYENTGTVSPYLYGHSTVADTYIDWDGYMLEGPFDADPGVAGVPPFSVKYAQAATVVTKELDLAGENLLPESDMATEVSWSGPSNWSTNPGPVEGPGSFVVDDVTGSRCVELIAGANVVVYQDWTTNPALDLPEPLTETVKAVIRADARVTNAAGFTHKAWLGLGAYDQNGDTLVYQTPSIVLPKTDGSWQHVAAEFSLPAGTKRLRVFVRLFENAGSGYTVRYDNVTFMFPTKALPNRPVLIYPIGPDQPAGTAVQVNRYRMRANLADPWGPWEAVAPDGLTQQPPLRYMQVELQLSTTDTTVTPQVDRLGIYD